MYLTPLERVTAIHKSPWKGVFAITGGGSGAIFELQKWGGSSATILEVTVPYATQSFINYVGGQPDKFCSSEGARALAMASFQRAIQLIKSDPSEKQDLDHLFGMGVSCSLAKGLKQDERAGRENHAWIAIQTADTTHVQHFVLEPGDRSLQEMVVSDIICHTLHAMCLNQPLGRFERLRKVNERSVADPAIRQIVLGESAKQNIPPLSLILSGSFNPLHEGHKNMAKYVTEGLDVDRDDHQTFVHYELCIKNAAKPPLDYVEIKRRLAGMETALAGTSSKILVSGASTFAEKAAIYPQPIFIVGYDTWVRILDPKYYENSVEKRDASLKQLEKSKAKFIVFGRVDKTGVFHIPEDHPLILKTVREDEFRVDMSSTQLRACTV